MAIHPIVVIPSLNGGWIEIHCGGPAVVLEQWRRQGFDPDAQLGRENEATDLVGQVSIHAPASSGHAPIAWPRDVQRRFAHFFAGITRMTHYFPQHAVFSDPYGSVSIAAEVYREPSDKERRSPYVRMRVRASKPRGPWSGYDLVLPQRKLYTVVESCCVAFPGLTSEDYHAAWQD